MIRSAKSFDFFFNVEIEIQSEPRKNGGKPIRMNQKSNRIESNQENENRARRKVNRKRRRERRKRGDTPCLFWCFSLSLEQKIPLLFTKR